MKHKKTEAFQKQNIVILILLLMLFVITLSLYSMPFLKPEDIPDNTVTRIIDGDTFELANKKIVRMICIDTPEINEKGYEEAKLFLESLILGKEVRLEMDVSNNDRYARLLRYVYINLSDNQEIFVNKEMVNQGYAEAFRYEPDVKKCEEIEN